MKVLTVIENATIQRITEPMFPMGYSVDKANSVVSALSSLQHSSYDLIFIELKEADCMELIKKIRSDLRKSTPILVVLDGNRDSVMEAKSLGANDYLVRPFDGRTLGMKVKELV